MLRAWSAGNGGAGDELFERIYGRLRRMAGALVGSGEDTGGPRPTAVLHEAYLRLLVQRRADWHDREHFFSIAALIMRRVLVDRARARRAERRGGGRIRVPLAGSQLAVPARRDASIALDQALHRLGRLDRRKVEVVEMRYFGGLTLEETATVLGCSPATVSREQQIAKAWLRRELEGGSRR